MKERILEILKEKELSYDFNTLMNMVKAEQIGTIQELTNALNELMNEGEVYFTRRQKYMYYKYSHLKRGKLNVNEKGFGFVVTDDPNTKDIYIDEKNLNGAINNDIVDVDLLTSETDPKIEGKIVNIVKRELNNLVGEFYFSNNKGHIKLDDKKIKLNIEIPREECEGLVDGYKVLVKVGRQINNNYKFKGKIVKILGHKDDPGIDIVSEAYKHGIEVDFPKEVITELDSIPTQVNKEDMTGRKDLRDEMIFTIDGDDTKDIDDAISIKKLDNGNYELGVHIADVSNYVKLNSELNKDALDRGTSVYLANTVIPMLPHKLSNGICSLNPNVDRLALSCVMEINNKGEVVNYDIFESVIKSRKQMTYKNVNKILEENVIPEGYEEFVDTLKLMKECSDIIRKSKIKRGYIDFDQTEIKIITDDTGNVIDIKPRERGIGENLIEDFMIVANETVATHVFYMDLPFIYRVHEEPDEEKIDDFLKYISILGYKINGKRKDLHPKRIQEILNTLKDTKEYKILSKMLLRSMKKAYYSKENLKHYGLASTCYTHFTSPIRRYPDLTVHRRLKEIIHGKIDNKTNSFWGQELIYIADHSSEKERASVECERDVDDMKVAEYMENHIGEQYKGMVSSITNFGMFVELDNLIEGLVHVKNMSDDHYNYDDFAKILKGERTGKIYKLGDVVDVEVEAASKENKTVDFKLVKSKKLERNNEKNI